MARRRPPSGKRRGRGREEEPEDDFLDEEEDFGGPETKASEASQFLTALLIVAFAFIFLGILLTWHHLHKHYDTPFLMVVKKNPGEEVKDDAAKALGVSGASADEEEEGEEGEEEESSEEDTEEEE